MLMNHKKEQDTAYIEYKLTVDTSDTLTSVRPYWLDVKNCQADPIYNIAGLSRRAARKAGPKATNKRFGDFKVQKDGYVVAGAGHVHGGARKLTITKPSCDDIKVAGSNPTWGFANHPFYNVKPVLHEPGPIGMSGFNTPTGIPVRAGSRLRLNSFYDAIQAHTRVMGIYVVYVAENEPGDPAPPACGGMPGDATFSSGTNGVQGRSTPVPFKIPLTGLNANGDAVTIKGPPGRFRRLRSGANVTVGDRFFSRRNVRVRLGAKLDYNFMGVELHNLTLANGPLGIGSPNLNGVRTYTQRFTRPGTYRLFCALHPVQMSQRVVVKKRRNRR
jgi:plastocyanin